MIYRRQKQQMRSLALILALLGVFDTASCLEDIKRAPPLVDTSSKDARGLGYNGPEFDSSSSQQRTEGKFTVLVTRIFANDSTPSNNKSYISDKTFGTHGDAINLKTQMAACSANKVQLTPVPDNSSAGLVDGVINVDINKDVTGISIFSLIDSVTEALIAQLGGTTPLEEISDFIFYCFPPAVKPFHASMKNMQISLYSDEACTSLSTTMHHIGIGLGFWYSGRFEEKYGDTSCTMGMGKRAISEHDSPQVCFNAAKNWQAGWFEDKVASVDPTKNFWYGILRGSVHYDVASKFQKIAIQIEGDSMYNYHVGINSQKGANKGTDEMLANQVIITQQEIGRSYSSIVAILDQGDRYVCASDSLKGIPAFQVKAFRINRRNGWAKIGIKETHDLFIYDVWAVTQKDELIRKNGSNEWENVMSKVQDVSVSGDGNGVWIVTTNKVLKTQTSGGGWKKLREGVEKVRVTLSGKYVWILTTKNELFSRKGEKGWIKRGTDIIEVAVSESGNHLIASKVNGETMYWRGPKFKFRTINRKRGCRVNAINNRGRMYIICGTNLWSHKLHTAKWRYIDKNYSQIALVNNQIQPFWRIGTESDLSEARCGKFEWNVIRKGIKYFAVRDLNFDV